MQHFNLKGLQNGPPQVCPEPSKTQLLGLFSGTSWGPFWGGRTGLGTADKALSCTPQTNRVFICCECAALYTRCRVVPSPLTPLLCAVQPCVCTSAYNRLLCFIWWVWSRVNSRLRFAATWQPGAPVFAAWTLFDSDSLLKIKTGSQDLKKTGSQESASWKVYSSLFHFWFITSPQNKTNTSKNRRDIFENENGTVTGYISTALALSLEKYICRLPERGCDLKRIIFHTGVLFDALGLLGKLFPVQAFRFMSANFHLQERCAESRRNHIYWYGIQILTSCWRGRKTEIRQAFASGQSREDFCATGPPLLESAQRVCQGRWDPCRCCCLPFSAVPFMRGDFAWCEGWPLEPRGRN